MKIKNILALGLVAVISGISTAQTYTATAGTNGTTDIQSDYSMATGDGASVSVDVPLEFELPKKVALALSYDGTTFTSNSLFTGMDSIIATEIAYQHSTVTYATGSSFVFNGNAQSNNTPRSEQYFRKLGALYSNTDNVQLTIPRAISFVHENGELAGQIDGEASARIKNDNGWSSWFPFSTGTVTGTINSSEAQTTGGNSLLDYQAWLLMASIDSTDRAGKYLATSTITLTIL